MDSNNIIHLVVGSDRLHVDNKKFSTSYDMIISSILQIIEHCDCAGTFNCDFFFINFYVYTQRVIVDEYKYRVILKQSEAW